MPKRCEYINPDGSIGAFNDWTEEWNQAQQEAEDEILHDPEKMKALEERYKRFEEATRRKAQEKQKNKSA